MEETRSSAAVALLGCMLVGFAGINLTGSLGRSPELAIYDMIMLGFGMAILLVGALGAPQQRRS
jgi:hypothetical protein